MRCPRCGADNADRAQRCYLCEYPFAASGDMAEPPAPDEGAQPQYPPPGAQAGMVPPGSQAVPPPPVTGAGYQPPPPGSYLAGYQPPPPAAKGPLSAKVIIAIAVVLLVVVIGLAAFFLLRGGKTYSIDVPPPPGYKEADQDLVDDMKESMGAGAEQIEVEKIYIDNSMTNFVIVASMDIPPSLGSDTPSGDDPAEMEEWFYENKDEWVDAFNTGIVQGAGGLGVSADVDLYEVEPLATGDVALHMRTTVAVLQTSFVIDTLWIIKGDSAFFVVVEGLNPGANTMDFLKENITFAED